MKQPFEIPCVILCGGRSSRMKEDKALLPFEKFNSLSSYQFNRLQKLFSKVYISSKNDKFDFLNKNELILDEGKIYSPIVALKTIFEKFPNKKVFIITVDNPLISQESISKLIEEANDVDICIASTQRIHNLCGVFSSSNIDIINEMLNEDIHKVGFLIKKAKNKIVKFDNEDEFINLNHKEDYNKACELIKA